MSVYTQQANNLMERLPISEQQFILELVKKISISYSLTEPNEFKSINQKQRRTIDSVIEILNSAEPLADDPIDEILTKGITLRTPEELDNL